MVNIRVIKKPAKCKSCGYKWTTKSKLRLVSCPSCMMKVRLMPKLKPGRKKK